MKRLMAFALSTILGLTAFSAAQAQEAKETRVQDIIARGEIVVAVDLASPPFGFLDDKQQPGGYGPALAQILADSLGVKLRIENVSGPTRIPTVLAGRADVVIATLSMTAERAAQVWFTNPYAPNPLVLAAPAASKYSTYADLVAGTRIAVPRGSPQDQSVTANAPDATILRFEDDASAQQALFTGQADLVGTGGMDPVHFNKMDPGKNYETKIVLQNLYMGMAVAPGNRDLLQYLNTFIFLQQQSGGLEDLSQKYIEVGVGNLPTF